MYYASPTPEHAVRRRTCSIAVCRALSVVFMVALVASTYAQSLPVTYKNSTYTLNYDTQSKRLECVSGNTNCTWRTTVSQNVGSFRDFAAIATAAGPVIVYSEGNQTLFVLLHFRTGSTTVERSGESLRGNIGAGWMLNCLMQPGQYGAKVICQTVVGTSIKEYKWDINMGGQHKLIGSSTAGTYTAGSAPRSQKYTNAGLKFSSDIPRGFRAAPQGTSAIGIYGPTDACFITVFSDAGATPIAELAPAYMTELGVTVTHKSEERLDNGQPALLMMGTGTVNGQKSLHAALFFSGGDRTYVLSYTAREDTGTAYLVAFEEVMTSFKPL